MYWHSECVSGGSCDASFFQWRWCCVARGVWWRCPKPTEARVVVAEPAAVSGVPVEAPPAARVEAVVGLEVVPVGVSAVAAARTVVWAILNVASVKSVCPPDWGKTLSACRVAAAMAIVPPTNSANSVSSVLPTRARPGFAKTSWASMAVRSVHFHSWSAALRGTAVSMAKCAATVVVSRALSLAWRRAG